MTNPRHKINPTLNLFKSRDVEQVKRWLSEGADVNGRNNKGNTALMNAARKGWVEAVEVLLDAGAAVDLLNEKGVGVNMMVARGHSSICVDKLMAAGMDPFLRDDQDRTGLMVATHPDVVRSLVKLGLSVHDVDKNGKGALHHLASLEQYCPPASIEALLSLGADLELRDDQGNTPLLCSGHQNLFKSLLENGARADAFNNKKNGVLHVIALHRLGIDPEVSELALSKGADPYLENHEGKLPIDLFQAHLDRLYEGHPVRPSFERVVNLLQCVALDRATIPATAVRQGGPRL